ncbi:MAG: 3-deoxy-manno-octulosonate cytidylyltransferase [bacterium]|nr:3-deoxy-manno-octulosonate cytidylyltransferase [bacterium]
MTTSAAVIIPARWASSRFPGKPLAPLAGHPVIRHVYAAATAACPDALICVATDDPRIYDAVHAFGGRAVLTRPDHPSGSDRILEALDLLDPHHTISFIVNLQGDEPLLPPPYLRKALAALQQHPHAHWATLVYPISSPDSIRNPNVVKVVMANDGSALYFSRAPIPFDRDATGAAQYFAHIGLYVYRAPTLRQFVSWPQGRLERSEKLEQLRALEHGLKILCVPVDHPTVGIDTPEDLHTAEALLRANPRLSALST